MNIAFCTTSMNRRWQAEQTLPWNLSVLRGTPHFIALCDYNSTDALEEYVSTAFAEDCRRGTLVYFRTTTPRQFHASKAKNTAHRLALRRDPDVLFNLDVDNFVTAPGLALLLRLFAEDPDACVHQWSSVWSDGSFGRIAVAARHWRRLGGYDEGLQEMAWQDIDLLYRARALGLRYHLTAEALRAPVQNSLSQKLVNTGHSFTGELGAQAQFRRLHQDNMVRALSRPITLTLDEQVRYDGRLNFSEEATI
jgi:hypothetical protein